jgi:EAL domain-containing protein (putative c-di-GMP-specific phosphodiesterase class I)
MGNGFEYLYQPIVDLNTLELVRYEALLRDPNGCNTQTLIEQWEADGRIVDLDLHTLERVINAASHDPHLKPTPVAVNVSAISIVSRDFQNEAERILWNRPLGVNLSIEITETQPITDLELAQRFVRRARAAGCHIGLDDYGDGHAILRAIEQLNLDYLKLSSTVTTQILHNEAHRRLVLGVVRYAQLRNIEIVAEHIDQFEQYLWLKSAGVALGQGWLFGKAASPIVDFSGLPLRRCA